MLSLKEYYKQQLLDQLDEAKMVRKKVNPKTVKPKKESIVRPSENAPASTRDWDQVNRDSRAHAQKELFPERTPSHVDDHLPGGAAAALERSRAAFADTRSSALSRRSTGLDALRSRELSREATKESKAAAKSQMIERYGSGKVTFSSSFQGHYVQHDDKKGDTYAHTFHPQTGKISRTPHVTSSYYGDADK